MAAYAALVSVMHTIDQIQNHPRPPISLHKLQVQSLTEKVTFLQDFLESCSINGGNKEADQVLESRIANAAYTAEDVIESHIVDQILSGSTTTRVNKISGSTDFYQDLQRVIQEMDLITIEAAKIKEETEIQLEQLQNNSMPAGLSRSSPSGKNTMVGLDDVKIGLMDKLTGHQSHRQIIPIVGMGGIGKTTLARNIYENPLIVQHFDILAWTTISQQHNGKEILLEILLCLKTSGSRESLSHMSEHELGEKLHKSLIGRRYIIVMDDIWSIEPWDNVRSFFPDNENGSRIMITTRLSNLACELTGSNGLKLDFLDEDKSWDLLRKNIDCPLELEEIGKKIAKKCKGLPLSIVVIGGLLAKSKGTPEHWKYIEENLNSVVKLENNERCSKILQMSYDHLPIHLKPCFLYMGVFPEDYEINVPDLMNLWVAEGFLKPISGKSLEEVAKESFNELVDRNLILPSQRNYNGKIRRFKIHDLVMDLCVKESQREKFLYLTRQHKLNDVSQDISTQRHIIVDEGTTPEIINALPCASLVRSLKTQSDGKIFPELFNYSLLRVWNGYTIYSNDWYSRASARGLVNCRYLHRIRIQKPESGFPSPFSLFWNLQTLFVYDSYKDTLPSEFWNMSQLRHVKLYMAVSLSDPPPRGDDEFVLTNLQTLNGLVYNFKCNEEVVKRIPNIKKLKLFYEGFEKWAISDFNNLGRLHKLESLYCDIEQGISGNNINVPSVGSEFVKNLSFPKSLKKLTLWRTKLQWEDVTTKIGLLPYLQVLKLFWGSVEGSEWETVEGKFCSLKYLQISNFRDLEIWTTESTHFPCLEHIVLLRLRNLKEIPLDIGEIPTLQSIELEYCSDSSIISAKEIVNEQEALGNEGFQVRVWLSEKNHVVESLVGPNFLVDLWNSKGTRGSWK